MSNLRVYTPDEARHKLKIGKTRFYELLHQGKIKSIRNGSRYLIPEQCLTEYIMFQTGVPDKKEGGPKQ